MMTAEQNAAARTAFLLTGSPWRVARGVVDVFLVRLIEGRPTGARFPVARFTAGETIFAAGTSESGHALLACPSDEAELVPAAADSDCSVWSARLAEAAGIQPGAALNGQLLEALAGRALDEETRRIAQMRARAESDGKLEKAALRRLAGALDAKPALSASRALSADGALFEAARAAGAATGVTIVESRGAANATAPIEALATASGVRSRRVALPAEWWNLDAGPMVGFLEEGGHAVALLPAGPGSYHLWDPLRGARQRINAAVARLLKPHAYVFYRPFPDQPVTLKLLLAAGLQGLRRDIVTVAVAGILAGLLGLLVPVMTGTLVDEVIPSAQRGQLIQVFAVLAVAAVTGWLLFLLRSLAVLRIEGRMESALQAAFWDRLLRLPAGFHRGYSAGDLATRSLGISAIRQTLTGTALSSILTGIFSTFGLGLMFSVSPALALPCLGLVMLSFAVTVGAALFQIRLQRIAIEKSGKLAGLLPQLLGGIAKLRVAGAEDRAFARWAERFAEQKKEAARARRISTLLQLFFGIFQTATSMALFAGLVHVTEQGAAASLTTGAFLSFQAAFLQVLGGATQLGTALVSVLAVVPTYERARPILEALPETTAGRSDPGTLSGEIELNQVAFRYSPDSAPVLQSVTLSIKAGQFAAIVGTSGSGKSTLLRLLLGFETPEAGSVFYDGQDLAGLDLSAVRRQTGVVLQHGGMLQGNLFENIIGSAPLTMDDAWEAARQAGLEDDIRAMPMGMHTLIPDGGLGLSGGQRQRLQIARAIVTRPRLIYFDEATSALDNQTQAVVMESLGRLKATRVVIAHRLSTIRNADRIFVLNKGVIEEAGTYDELMARGGLFESMARRQLA